MSNSAVSKDSDGGRSAGNDSVNSRSIGVKEVKVPGHMDLISGTKLVLKKYKPSVVICIGVVIRGESDIYEAQCNALANSLSHLAVTQDVPIIQGLLMCKDEKQA